MTTEDLIKDEKLLYNINRDAAKISALSSGKIDKYEYLTGKEILPSNQQQIIEQAKFTYSPLRKAFEKQTKTIKDQGKKQVDALESLKPKKVKSEKTKSTEYSSYFINGLAEIRESTKPINFHDEDLTYNFKGNTAPIRFNDFKGPMHIFKSIYNGDRTLEDIEKKQEKLGACFGHIIQGPSKYKSFDQLDTIQKVRGLYDSREKVVKMFNDYAKNMSEGMYESKQEGRGLKILTPNQMLKRLQ